MSQAVRPRSLAVLETSFWVAAHQATVAANCLDFFDIVVPVAVEREIRSIQVADPRREYPYATLFRHLRDRMLDPPSDAPPALPDFGRGEAAALPLAEHLNATLLVNERQATRYAVRRGLKVLTVPIFVVGLCDQGVISKRAAERKLELLQSITSRSMIAEAQILLDGL